MMLRGMGSFGRQGNCRESTSGKKKKIVRIGLYIEADVECQRMTQMTEYVYIYNTSWLGYE